MRKYCKCTGSPFRIAGINETVNFLPSRDNGVCSECNRPAQCKICDGDTSDGEHHWAAMYAAVLGQWIPCPTESVERDGKRYFVPSAKRNK